MPARDDTVTTIDQLLALPEDGMRHELLDGVHVVTPAPRLAHQAILGEFHFALRTALDTRPDLLLLASPADIRLGPTTLVQPDLFVLAQDPALPVRSWEEAGVPVLAVEFLSPTTAARDRGAKRRIYQRAGVEEYWIVDLDARMVERWTPSDDRPEIVHDALRWTRDGQAIATVDLPPIFERLDR